MNDEHKTAAARLGSGLSRPDLIRAVAREAQESYAERMSKAQQAVDFARGEFERAILKEVSFDHGTLIDSVLAATSGREGRLEKRVVYDIESAPTYAMVIVSDGANYDNNFRLQLNVLAHGSDVVKWKGALRALATVVAGGQKLVELEKAARDDVIREALVSTDRGKRILAELSELRRDVEAGIADSPTKEKKP